MKSWAVSLMLHGTAAAVAAMLWTDRVVESRPEAMRWAVTFTQPQQMPPAPPPAKQAAAPKTPIQQALRPSPPPAAPARQTEAPEILTAAAPPAAPATSESPAAAPARQDAIPVPAHAADEIERRWYLALLEQLRALKRYPMTARRLGQEGVVLIEARIGADGQLENMAVKQGSGYSMLDRSALELFESAAAKARHQLRPERPTRLEIPIAYKLES